MALLEYNDPGTQLVHRMHSQVHTGRDMVI
jgi:hypothetical protein